MEYAGYRTLKFTTHDRVLTITIDSQGPMNAVDEHMHEDLARVFYDAQRDPESDQRNPEFLGGLPGSGLLAAGCWP